MKTIYHEFKLDKRHITICATHRKGTCVVSFGISIANPEDKLNQELGRTIASGRAKKSNKIGSANSELSFAEICTMPTHKVLKTMLQQVEYNITNNPIKFIPPIKKELLSYDNKQLQEAAKGQIEAGN